MRKKMSKKLLSVAVAAAMVMSLAACGDNGGATEPTEPAVEPATTEPATTEPAAEPTVEPAADPAEEVSPYTVITDASGNPINLGGMEIIIRDWWSSDEEKEPTNDYEEAQQEYREWIQETYNFKIKQVAISDWGTTPSDYVDYVTSGGDDTNYVFTLRDDPAITSAMSSGLMYDLSTLDCLDFSEAKFQRNKLHEQYGSGSAIYAMYAGFSEARTGVYFNKRVLTEAGIDPEDIYQAQRDGSWTWDKFAEMMKTVHRDTDNDGVVDVYGLTVNESNMTNVAVFSNGGSYIDKDASGYVYNLENPATVEALEWVVEMYDLYDNHDPEGAQWDYYKEEFLSGNVGFMVDDEYCGCPGNFLQDMTDELGFVMFPKGPQGKDYINVWSNNPAAIPACYDADRAWKIAFAWNLYTNEPAGYEDYINLSSPRDGIFDATSVDETITMMMQPEHGTVAYHGMIPNLNLGPDLTWGIGPGATVSEKIDAIKGTWTEYVNAANGN